MEPNLVSTCPADFAASVAGFLKLSHLSNAIALSASRSSFPRAVCGIQQVQQDPRYFIVGNQLCGLADNVANDCSLGSCQKFDETEHSLTKRLVWNADYDGLSTPGLAAMSASPTSRGDMLVPPRISSTG
jgi:hypothetical protein